MERWKECDYYEILLYYARHESFMEKKNLKSHLKMKTHAGKKKHADFIKKKKVNSKNV